MSEELHNKLYSAMSTYVRLQYLSYIRSFKNQIADIKLIETEVQNRMSDKMLPEKLLKYCLKVVSNCDVEASRKYINDVLIHKNTISEELLKEIKIHQLGLINKLNEKKL